MTAAASLDGLATRLTGGALVTAPEIIEGYRRDRADLVPAGVPLALVRATCTEDVVATMRWAHEGRVPVVPRGAGTGLSGGATALAGCIVLSLERMDAIREVDVDDQLVVVEPGVINADIGRAVEPHGLFYPPDPGSFEISTIGGNLATNAGGLRCVKYGVTRDAVLGLEVVLADGRVLHTGGRTVKSVAGYDMTRLMVGSEGTLGVITAATLRVRPRPPMDPVTFVASFASLPAAGAAVSAIIRSGLAPSLLELMDRATINAIEDYRRLDLDRSAAALLIGQSDGSDADRQVEAMTVCCAQAGADLIVRSSSTAEAEMLLRARRLAGEATMAAGPTIIEDVGVPRSRLADLLLAVGEIAADTGIPIATVGHAGDGNMHPTLMLPDLDPDTLARAFDTAERVCRAALALGGTITGEHGVGALKRSWLAGEIDETSLAMHRAIKAAFDPRGILNPGRGF
ncbi:glycolate oxidase [Modestobacter sp. DSM 44400]|uniref:FAD-binding oxidoreductase n=1 Tax=Modestobacter sp. DSM 44400 TaxID=1550230 RepID=UPI000898084A|nr:FAD-linked oxidase C-terminal domain-containing protein [Modestobacter sp. DSM 44400]SDY34273.1 glycolate oxidase [Modestobacter sp. DSM 44400]